MTDISCISYEKTMIELFLPSPIIFATFCVSTDRTSLFIVSFVRLLLYVIIYYVMSDIVDFNQHPYVKYVFGSLIVINVIYLILILFKRPVYSMGSDYSMLQRMNYDTRLSNKVTSTTN